MNVQQAITRFLEHGSIERNLSTRTLRAYESDLAQFDTHLEGAEAVSITHDDLEQYVDKLGTGSYRDTSIRRKVAALKVFFRYLEESGIVPESPARKLKIKHPVENKVPVVLSSREVKSLLSAPKRQIEELVTHRHRSAGGKNRYFCAIRDNAIIELLFLTGIRIGELVALAVGDVDLENRQIHVTGRGTRGRNVPLASDEIVSALGEYLALREERRIEGPALFVGRAGTRLTIYSIENIFKKQVRLAQIKRHITPHALRHTKAAMMVSSGADIRNVQEMLGHASILSTQVYRKLSIRKRRSAPGQQRSSAVSLDGAMTRLPIKK
ncbi:MAG: tyrosine-type recombinase/integrase [Acidobacteriota bacterium]